LLVTSGDSVGKSTIVDRPFRAVKPTLRRMRSLHVHLLPSLVKPAELNGSTCVVIDVLRATTTIATALAAGAKEILPCLEVADAHRLAASLPAGSYLLGGERGGKKIDGFDLGNSPAEYRADLVVGKTIIFTTTNGTRALLACHGAELVLCGAFVNLSPLCEAIRKRSNIHLICAGTDDQISREDVLLAGAIVDRLTDDAPCSLNDEASLAKSAWQELKHFDNIKLGENLKNSRGARNLAEIGMGSDILLACVCNSTSIVPYLAHNRLTPLDVG
jgi:2-phosphosulfolactate phosphatase